MSTAASPVGALKSDDAAHYLGISPGHLRNLRVAGTGPTYTKLGRAVVYRVIDLDDYLEARVVR